MQQLNGWLSLVLAAALVAPGAIRAEEVDSESETAEAASEEPAAESPAEAAPEPAVEAEPAAGRPAEVAGDEPDTRRKGIQLPGNIRINGKFDVAYERTGYSSNLRKGQDALRNYHRFVFLSRHADDPYFFSAELVDRWFYEFGMRFRSDSTPWRGSFKAGKVVVPFGADPVYHQSYGGRAGFDQQILPVIWSQHGVVGEARYSIAGVGLRAELYGIQGYDLPASDAVLNLQGDTSSAEDIKFGIGTRLGASWGPVSLWYSLYTNDLAFGRRLLMQALDLVVWRIGDLPVLEDLSLRAGAMRADVSGGGAGLDHYHFGNYLELRYYPLDWLYVQARTGLRTHDNREGFYYDERGASSQDSSSHNLGVVYERDGWMLAVHHYWNFEKADEIDNDFLRVRLGYEF